MTHTQFNEIQMLGSHDRVNDMTFGEWTVKWWNWILSIPFEKNPLRDETGEFWNINQPKSDVWFLAGNKAFDIKKKDTEFVRRKLPTRRIMDMPAGRNILFPILNCVASYFEYPDKMKNHDDLIRHVGNDVGSVRKKDLSINDRIYEATRIFSDPRIFKLRIIQDNVLSITQHGITDAAAEGYWAFLKPLHKGHYRINFEGSCENGTLCSGANYEIDVI